MFSRGLLGALFASCAWARPVVIENAGSFTTPDPAYTTFGGDVAVDGDYAIVLATRQLADPEGSGDELRGQTAFIYRRGATGWSVVRRLNEYQVLPPNQHPLGVAMRGGIAVAQIGPVDVWELGNTGWIRTASLDPGDSPNDSVSVDGADILNGQGACSWNAQLYRKTGAATWSNWQTLEGYPRADGCDDGSSGGAAALSGIWAAVLQPKPEGRISPSALIFRDYGDAWSTYGEAVPEDDVTTFGPALDMFGTDVVVGGSDATGALVYREQPALGFHLSERVRSIDSFMGAGPALGFAHDGDLLLQGSFNHDRGAGVVNVFRRAAGKYEHVATLVGRNGESLGGAIAISGRRVLVGGDDVVYWFDLPTSLVTAASFSTPSARQETFQTGNGDRKSVV